MTTVKLTTQEKYVTLKWCFRNCSESPSDKIFLFIDRNVYGAKNPMCGGTRYIHKCSRSVHLLESRTLGAN